MGITKTSRVSHKASDHVQVARAVDGVFVVFPDRRRIYAKDSAQTIVVRRSPFEIRGTYRYWRYLRERILNRKHLSIEVIQKLAWHYGFGVYPTDKFPPIDNVSLRKEVKPHEPDVANRI